MPSHSAEKSSQEPQDDGYGLHFYTRVRIIDVHFCLARQASGNISARPIILSAHHFENDFEDLVEYLANSSGLSSAECSVALQDPHDGLLDLLTATLRRENICGGFEVFTCLWSGCVHRTPFFRNTSLWRHIKTQHIPEEGC